MHRHGKAEPLIRLARGADRRAAERLGEPPYITEEGLVLVDRRSYLDRRQEGFREGAVTANRISFAA